MKRKKGVRGRFGALGSCRRFLRSTFPPAAAVEDSATADLATGGVAGCNSPPLWKRGLSASFPRADSTSRPEPCSPRMALVCLI